MKKIWHLVLCTAVLTTQNAAHRFDSCGKPAGVVMTSRSTAYMSKILAMCGKSLILKYAASNEALARGINLYCLIARLCYAFHGDRTSYPEPERMFATRIRNCIVKAGLVTARWNEHLLPNKSVESVVHDANRCIPDRMIPKDVKLLTSAMRYARTLL
ncbi:uncharacterized protein LOC135366050 [Ornithodoros turicata]|uniref:uncharacterized protein LOC135366050 n=1 Tax=Ornithodoros turicata TaxID=34597 RepID=UPI00313A1998